MTMADVIMTRSHDCRAYRLIVVATVTNRFPRCNHCVSDSCPRTVLADVLQMVHVDVRVCPTEFRQIFR